MSSTSSSEWLPKLFVKWLISRKIDGSIDVVETELTSVSEMEMLHYDDFSISRSPSLINHVAISRLEIAKRSQPAIALRFSPLSKKIVQLGGNLCFITVDYTRKTSQALSVDRSQLRYCPPTTLEQWIQNRLTEITALSTTLSLSPQLRQPLSQLCSSALYIEMVACTRRASHSYCEIGMWDIGVAEWIQSISRSGQLRPTLCITALSYFGGAGCNRPKKSLSNGDK